jgi:membrane-associated protease RseP (regulator of RpoE activity)
VEERSFRSFQHDTFDSPESRENFPPWHDARNVPGWAEVLPEGYVADEYHEDHRPVRRRRVALPLFLFIATCFSTFLAGMAGQHALSVLLRPALFARVFQEHWQSGLAYMLAVMGILLAHEMGHFLQALRYRVNASLPFFIPMPISPIGTMGAVIGMQGSQANRKELFDIGLSGPLAGLVLAIPIAWYGVMQAEVVPKAMGGLFFGDPLIMQYMMQWLRPEVGPHETLVMNPFLMAGWVGLLITGLNMVPISQLDGGHVSYALFGRGAWFVARLVLFGVMAFILFWQAYQWLVMLLLVMAIGTDHPPTRNDHVPIGWWRYLLGLASLAIPIFCLAPIPISEMPQ